ncbi:DUF2806 domain-containing protein [Rhodomicrobium vannielii]|uniref:DUF2806 domain-containing protein n=1 Tax=Rhodomicrobium vannielii TaxID=1069 RepID=UPI0009D66672|nr:DUF2806 domain-containing protein [Rhodomicrobium vannielii]
MEIKDLVGIAKPLEKLVEVVAAGVGVLYEPSRTRNNAKAEAEAAIVTAQANAKADNIAYRAKCRIEAKEIRRQENIEAVISRASKFLPTEVSQEPVSKDWAADFFEEYQDINDEELRGIWARILAGEVTQPGSFSRRTLRVLKDSSMQEASKFQSICSYLWFIPTPSANAPLLIIPDVSNEKLNELNIRCLIPAFDGALFSLGWKDALWDKFFMGAPQRLRRSVERYSIVKRA